MLSKNVHSVEDIQSMNELSLIRKRLINSFIVDNPILIVEGIDCSGKTTLIQQLRLFTGATSIHPSNVDTVLHDSGLDIFDEYSRIWSMCKMFGNRGILLDRFLGSEYAYSWYDEHSSITIDKHMGVHLLGDENPKDFKQFSSLLESVCRTSNCTTLIYVNCDFEDYCERQEGNKYSQEQFELYTSRYRDFIKLWEKRVNALNTLSPVIDIDTTNLDETQTFLYLVRMLKMMMR